MSEINNYVCPYCGREIDKDKVLFWETVKTQYTDNIRGEFLRRHGVKVAAGNKFPRMYYRARPECVTREDKNGYPTMIEDHMGNAVAPEELDRADAGSRSDAFDDDFDADSFDSGETRKSERQEREIHNIPKRACPFCHCELPQQFGNLPTRHVAMFGGRASGKTAYLVNLFQQLNSQLGANNLGSVELETESMNFLRPMIDDYERNGTTQPTPADGGLLPIVCRYRNRGSEAFITIYDIAGEGTADPAYMANHKGIANCETLLLMVDPNMFVGGAFYQQWTANHASGGHFGGGDECCKEPLDSFLNLAGELCKEYSERIRTVVCVLTKMDMLLESKAKLFSAGDIELLNDVRDKHREAVNLPVLAKVSREIQTYLAKEQRINLKDKLSYTFGSDVRIAILGVSTSTRVKGSGNEIVFEPRSSAMDAKHRIIEPFLVVLMYFGLVPAVTADGKKITFSSGLNGADDEAAQKALAGDAANERPMTPRERKRWEKEQQKLDKQRAKEEKKRAKEEKRRK